MKLRKLLAVLSAVFMLCTVLPLSGLVCTAAGVTYDGYFYNGDFEAGTANWTMHNDTDTVTEVVEDPTGSGQGKVMHTNSTYTSSTLGCDLMFNQVVAVEANTDLVLKFKVYCYSPPPMRPSGSPLVTTPPPTAPLLLPVWRRRR